MTAWKNKETAAVWHDLLENWERVENFYANAKDFRMVVSTIKENFEVQNGIKIRSIIDGGPFIEELFLLALRQVDWRQITERLLEMLALQAKQRLFREEEDDDNQGREKQ